MPVFTFRKEERLKSKKLISLLFSKGRSLTVYPLKIVYLKNEDARNDESILFSCTVPKKTFKKAVTRNLLKRRIREAYRLEKNQIIDEFELVENEQYAIMLIFIGQEVVDYAPIQKAMRKGLHKFFSRITDHTS